MVVIQGVAAKEEVERAEAIEGAAEMEAEAGVEGTEEEEHTVAAEKEGADAEAQ